MKYHQEAAQMDVPVIPRALYVSHKHEINEQAAARLRRFIPEADITFFNPKKAKNRAEADFTFATIQGIYSKLHTFDPEDFENIFWDEAHHLEARTFKKVLEYFRPLFESAATATVERMDNKDIRDYFGEAVFSKGLPDGIAEGWLAEVDYQIIFDKAVREEVAKGFNPKSLQEIKNLFKKEASPETLADSIREEIEKLGLKDPKTMIFCESTDEADEMAELLGGVAYHSYTKDRKKVLRDYKSGAIGVVTTLDMFNEGVDVPDAQVVVFLRATQSGPLFEQQLGRGLRKIPGKDKVYVLDYVANIERIAKVRELSDAIQQRSRDLGDDTVDMEDGASGGGGMKVHSRHGDFDFDSLAVNLLERYTIITAGNPLKAKSNLELVELARSLSSSAALGRIAVDKLSAEGAFISSTEIRKRFGSFAEFQKACGFEPLREFGERKNIVPQEMGAKEIIALAKEISPDEPLGIEHIKELSREGKFLSPSTIYKHFGSMPNFRKACGFGEDRKGTANKMTNDEIVATALVLKSDGPLSSTEIIQFSKENKFVSYEFLRKRFGSLEEFQRSCGYEPSGKLLTQQMTNEEIISRAHELKSEGPLSRKEIDDLSRNRSFVSYDSIKKRFGSMEGFREAWVVAKTIGERDL